MSVVDDFSLFLTNVFGAQVLERFFQLFDISVCSSFDPDQNAATPQSGFVNLSPIFRDTSTNQRADYSAGGASCPRTSQRSDKRSCDNQTKGGKRS